MTVNIDTFISSSTDFVLVSKSSVQGTVGKYVAIDENVAKALADITTHVEKSATIYLTTDTLMGLDSRG